MSKLKFAGLASLLSLGGLLVTTLPASAEAFHNYPTDHRARILHPREKDLPLPPPPPPHHMMQNPAYCYTGSTPFPYSPGAKISIEHSDKMLFCKLPSSGEPTSSNPAFWEETKKR